MSYGPYMGKKAIRRGSILKKSRLLRAFEVLTATLRAPMDEIYGIIVRFAALVR